MLSNRVEVSYLVLFFVIIALVFSIAILYDFVLVRLFSKRRTEISGPYHSSTWSSQTLVDEPETPVTPITPYTFSYENLAEMA